MFKIIKEDKVLGTVATLAWVKLQDNGCFGLCTEEDAHGVVVNGAVYHIAGKPELPGHDTVVVAPIDEIAYQQEQTSAQEAKRLQMNTALAALENENAMLKAKVSAQSAVASITFVALAESGGLDEVTASEHAELFAEWAYPVAYTVGQLRRYNGTLYKCVQAHTSQADWTPDTAASLWSVAADPAEEWPAWSQPIGAHDAYAKGAKVSHNGKHWTSSVDSNVWEPGVYGWTEATE
jgi:hypothetical protein